MFITDIKNSESALFRAKVSTLLGIPEHRLSIQYPPSESIIGKGRVDTFTNDGRIKDVLYLNWTQVLSMDK